MNKASLSYARASKATLVLPRSPPRVLNSPRLKEPHHFTPSHLLGARPLINYPRSILSPISTAEECSEQFLNKPRLRNMMSSLCYYLKP